MGDIWEMYAQPEYQLMTNKGKVDSGERVKKEEVM